MDVYALSIGECRIEPIPLLVILEFLMNCFHILGNLSAQVDIALCIIGVYNSVCESVGVYNSVGKCLTNVNETGRRGFC